MTTATTTAIEKRDNSPLYAMAERYNMNPKDVLPILKNTVLKPVKGREATNAECCAFVIVCNEYLLNPFTRQIHGFVSDGGVVPIVGVDGWAYLVNRQDGFDGCDFEEERDPNDGRLVSVTCTMYHKHRSHPVRVRELMGECRRNTAPWNQMPSRMLRHKAFMQAARMAFGLSGLYDDDEARDIVKTVNATVVETRQPAVLELEELAQSTEENRGHGNEGFDSAPASDATPVIPEPGTEQAPEPDLPREVPLAYLDELKPGERVCVNGMVDRVDPATYSGKKIQLITLSKAGQTKASYIYLDKERKPANLRDGAVVTLFGVHLRDDGDPVRRYACDSFEVVG